MKTCLLSNQPAASFKSNHQKAIIVVSCPGAQTEEQPRNSLPSDAATRAVLSD